MLDSVHVRSCFRVFAISFACCFMASSARAATTTVAEALVIGDTVSGSLQYGRRVITLPEGDWRVIYKNRRNASTDGPGLVILELSFDQIRDGRLSRSLEVAATLHSKTVNWIDEPCKEKGDSFMLEDRKRSFNDQFCVRVGFSHGIVDGARGEVFQSWAREIVAKRVGYSPEMPYVSVVRYTPYDFLSMRIGFDPSVVGIGPSKRPGRTLNDWQPQNAAGDPERMQFYDALVKWSNTFASAVARAAEGDEKLTPADFGSPVLAKR